MFLIISALFISILGLLQYAFLPDTRFLKAYGWDDHYYRLISTFLDPAYTAILLVFSFLFTAFGWKTDNRLLKFSSLGIITISLLLTYSRASYLALFFGVVVYSIKSEKIKLKYLLFTVLFVLSLFFLPRAVGGEGVHLERTFSLFLKIQNSVDTLKLTQASPLFGVGYNYLCAARVSLEGVQSLALYSHSCSGADNSLVFIYSTLGTVGVIFILWQLYRFAKKFDTPLLFGVFAALVFHTQFTNTIFYPWVFMWVVFLVLLETD